MSVQIINGDCLDVLRTLPDGSVNCCVTSPPYWGLRDYQTATWEGGIDGCDHADLSMMGGQDVSSKKQHTNIGTQLIQYKSKCMKCGAVRIDRQIGLEKSPDEYVSRLVSVFDEVRRVLREDGTLWLNIGDSYAGNNSRASNGGRAGFGTKREAIVNNLSGDLKSKDLVGIPWMLAFALRAKGWYLRQDIIWAKPNPMPESVTDRCTKAHEYIFLLSKSARYYYDADAIKEPSIDQESYDGRRRRNAGKMNSVDPINYKFHGSINDSGELRSGQTYPIRNKRSVWTVATQPYSGAHFATFPPDLITPCILAGCPENGTVLDPFGGSGTVGMVSERNGRNSILIELNPKYVKLAEQRTNQIGIFT